MLNKINFQQNISCDSIKSLRREISPERFLKKIGLKKAEIQRNQAGTLSASFIIQANQQKIFLKTHITEQGRFALEREEIFLKQIYTNPLQLLVHGFSDPIDKRFWLVMPMFEKNETALSHS